MIEPPPGYCWIQRDALTLRCKTCGEKVSADVVDLHDRECTGAGRDPVPTNEVPRDMYGRGLDP